MAKIKVKHGEFVKASEAVDSYVELLKNRMKSADAEVTALAAGWEGKDYASFKAQWATVDDKDSVHAQMIKAMESYSMFLLYADKQYTDAQKKAIARASMLL